MNIGIIGAGGVGGYVCCRLSTLAGIRDDINLFVIARGPHLDAIRTNGLRLESAGGTISCIPEMATDRIADIPELDICIITVKSCELDNVCEGLRDKISAHTLIVPLLNGADIAERIRTTIRSGIILPACIYIIAYIEKPGTVRQKIENPLIHLGSETGSDSAEDAGAANLPGLFESSGIRCRWHNDPRSEIWRKFLFIASFSLVTAGRNMTIGEVIESGEASSEVRAVLEEIHRIARARGVELDEDVCEKAFALGGRMERNATTSFQRDFSVEGKPDERGIFGDSVIRMGRESGVSVKTVERLYGRLQKMKPLAQA